MKVTVEITEEVVARARELKDSLQTAGVKVVLVHGQFDIAKKLSEMLQCPVIEAKYLRYETLPSNVHIVLVDGDLIDDWDAKSLDELDVPGTVLAPRASELVPLCDPVRLMRALRPPQDIIGRHYLDDEPPRTFACHHMRLKCGNCESSVNRWITNKRYA